MKFTTLLLLATTASAMKLHTRSANKLRDMPWGADGCVTEAGAVAAGIPETDINTLVSFMEDGKLCKDSPQADAMNAHYAALG